MARYYFDIHDGGGTTVDDTGAELPSPEAARKEALAALGDIARDLALNHAEGRVAIRIRDDGDPPFMEVAVTFEARTVGK